MRNEISEIGDHEAADTQSIIVPGGGAIIEGLQPNQTLSPAANLPDDQQRVVTHASGVVRSGGATRQQLRPSRVVSPAALHSDGQAHPAPHAGRVVRRGGATKGKVQPNEPLSPAAKFSDDQVQVGTQRAPVVSRGRSQTSRDTQSSRAPSSKNCNGHQAVAGEADQIRGDTQRIAVGFHVSIPGDHKVIETHHPDVSGGEASHSSIDTLRAGAGLSNPFPDDHHSRATQNAYVVGGEASHLGDDTHERGAGLSNPFPDDHSPHETHSISVVGPGDASQLIADTQKCGAGLSVLIEEIREQWRRRQVWHRAEKSLTLQAKATCRRLVEGDKIKANALFKVAYEKCDGELAEVAFAATFPLVEAGKSVELHRKAVEKRLLQLAGQLPIAGFILSLRGVGLLSLAGIIGEAGDLSTYDNPAKLWKRMGMGLVDGGRQRRVTDKEAAIKHGYSPSRRSHMWNIGSCIIKAGGPLKDLYVERKEYELTKPETASKLHAHRKAQRYVEKRLLREMWCEWRKH